MEKKDQGEQMLQWHPAFICRHSETAAKLKEKYFLEDAEVQKEIAIKKTQ